MVNNYWPKCFVKIAYKSNKCWTIRTFLMFWTITTKLIMLLQNSCCYVEYSFSFILWFLLQITGVLPNVHLLWYESNICLIGFNCWSISIYLESSACKCYHRLTWQQFLTRGHRISGPSCPQKIYCRLLYWGLRWIQPGEQSSSEIFKTIIVI